MINNKIKIKKSSKRYRKASFLHIKMIKKELKMIILKMK